MIFGHLTMDLAICILYHTSVSNHGGLFGGARFSERRCRVRTLRWRALGARFGANTCSDWGAFGAVVGAPQGCLGRGWPSPDPASARGPDSAVPVAWPQAGASLGEARLVEITKIEIFHGSPMDPSGPQTTSMEPKHSANALLDTPLTLSRSPSSDRGRVCSRSP